MNIKNYYENPRVSDTVQFILYTPQSDNCFNSDPYEVVELQIYKVVRNFSSTYNSSYDYTQNSFILQQKYYSLQQQVCENPDDDTLKQELEDLKQEIAKNSNISSVVYEDAIPVQSYGSYLSPVWTQATAADSIIQKTDDPNGIIQYGVFQFLLNTNSYDAGDYFICWRWKPYSSSGTILASNIYFSLLQEPVTVIRSAKNTQPRETNFEDLLNTYTPEMYKIKMKDDDLTPEVLSKYNTALGKTFLVIDDLISGIYSLQDPNTIPDPLLSNMSSLFNLVLRSTDSNRWRAQIGNAVPVYKQKGTLAGLRKALELAGVNLIGYTQYWQVVSSYTWIESFNYIDSVVFELAKISLPINSDNFAIYLRKNGEETFSSKNLADISIETISGISFLTWNGSTLRSGDTLKLLYQIKEIPNELQQQLENYVRTLNIADDRDDRDVEYPPKNWNLRLIEEADPLFNDIIPIRNPFHDPIVFGQVRTIFPYSENIYNADEYNGSLRDSTYPKDIDKNFMEECSGGISSCFGLDVSIDEINTARLNEVLEIVNDYKPINAVLHSLNYEGYLNDFIMDPEEYIEFLIQYSGEENCIAGNAQFFFERAMQFGLTLDKVTRSELGNLVDLGSESVQGYNDSIVLFCGIVNFSEIGLAGDSSNTFLEVFSPSTHAGNYVVSNPSGTNVSVSGVSEPLSASTFTFRLSNKRYSSSQFDITQKQIFSLADPSLIIEDFYITTLEDVIKGLATTVWQVKFTNTNQTYYIEDINTNGSIVLQNNGTLPDSGSNINYQLLNNVGDVILTSAAGTLTSYKYGELKLNDVLVTEVRDVLKIGWYFRLTSTGNQYQIIGFKTGTTDTVLIDSWVSGDGSGLTGTVLQRLVSEANGIFNYKGMYIEKPSVLPTFADPNSNTALENNTFRENYLLVIGDYTYSILEEFSESSVDYLRIAGVPVSWGTFLSGGTTVSVDTNQIQKIAATIQGHSVDRVDRAGLDDYTILTEVSSSFMFLPQSKKDDGISDNVQQEEKISFTIEYKNGTKQEGEIQ